MPSNEWLRIPLEYVLLVATYMLVALVLNWLIGGPLFTFGWGNLVQALIWGMIMEGVFWGTRRRPKQKEK